MNTKTRQYLAHPENRMHICQTNRLLFESKGDYQQAENARLVEYQWLSKAEWDQTEHF